MKTYPLEQLLTLRTVRIELALAELRDKQRAKAVCEANCERLQQELEQVLLRRLREQQRLSGASGVCTLADLMRRDERIAFFAEQAEGIGSKLVAAQRALETAQTELRMALKVYTRAAAKRDSLLECKSRWRREEGARLERIDELEVEQMTLFRFSRIGEPS